MTLWYKILCTFTLLTIICYVLHNITYSPATKIKAVEQVIEENIYKAGTLVVMIILCTLGWIFLH